MAGAGTTFFTAKRTALQESAQSLAQQASSVGQKLQAANNALSILQKATITQQDAENLIAFYEQVSGG